MRLKHPAVEVPSLSQSVRIDPAQIAYSVKQAAVVAGLTYWRIYIAIKQGFLPARRNGEGRRAALVVLRADLQNYLQELPPDKPTDAAWLAKRRVA
jgi:hypothetical protein